jgi:hypothetical protein
MSPKGKKGSNAILVVGEALAAIPVDRGKGMRATRN